jgi:hypothetical protein
VINVMHLICPVILPAGERPARMLNNSPIEKIAGPTLIFKVEVTTISFMRFVSSPSRTFKNPGGTDSCGPQVDLELSFRMKVNQSITRQHWGGHGQLGSQFNAGGAPNNNGHGKSELMTLL